MDDGSGESSRQGSDDSPSSEGERGAIAFIGRMPGNLAGSRTSPDACIADGLKVSRDHKKRGENMPRKKTSKAQLAINQEQINQMGQDILQSMMGNLQEGLRDQVIQKLTDQVTQLETIINEQLLPEMNDQRRRLACVYQCFALNLGIIDPNDPNPKVRELWDCICTTVASNLDDPSTKQTSTEEKNEDVDN